MTDLFLAFDDEDHEMGAFNRGCIEDFESYFHEKHPIKPKYIKTRTLNAANLELSIGIGVSKGTFVFSAYSHGYVDRLVANKSSYVDEYNVTLFKNALFYTVSCSSGNSLADQLLESGCACFFGYKCPFHFWAGYKEFSECANFGLFRIFEGFSTVHTYHQMVEKYNECIDRLVEEGSDSFMQAALLRENRDGLVRKGDDILIDDF